jgi:hypothetical protein
MILKNIFIFSKYDKYSEINLYNPKGASLKDNRLMTTAHNVFRFITHENNLQLFKPIKTQTRIHDYLFGYGPTFHIRKVCVYSYGFL